MCTIEVSGVNTNFDLLIMEDTSVIEICGQISLVKLIENLDKSKFTPHLIVSEEGELSELMRKLGIKVFIFGIPGFKLNNYFRLKEKKREFQEIITSNNIDIIHSDNDKFSFSFTKLICPPIFI